MLDSIAEDVFRIVLWINLSEIVVLHKKRGAELPALSGGADGSRTRDPLTASQVLIPTELQPL